MLCDAGEAPNVCIRVNFVFKNKGMALLWLQWCGAHYQFCGGVTVVSWNNTDLWFLPWSGPWAQLCWAKTSLSCLSLSLSCQNCIKQQAGENSQPSNPLGPLDNLISCSARNTLFLLPLLGTNQTPQRDLWGLYGQIGSKTENKQG